MAKLSKTWWGNRFIEALESFTDSGRLSRGRSYASDSRIRKLEITDGIIKAAVRGNINPHFGVHKEPTYQIEISMPPLSSAQWAAAIAFIASKASFISKLMLNEMPDNIEAAFTPLQLNLLPKSKNDFETHCSCPDWGNPCKHVAGVCYRVAAELDRDPFLLFELRGLPRERLQAELKKLPLGEALAAELSIGTVDPTPIDSYYIRPQVTAVSEDIRVKTFWQCTKPLPKSVPTFPPSTITGIVVKKQGDRPPFWHKDSSFIAAMEELYDRVKSKNQSLF
ncbi:MAG: hypothetical protein F6K28_50520 [Microcoleus sp. SIO2G3]|nr:hypothetical protein [Microcoleus sp. SIO2G3]